MHTYWIVTQEHTYLSHDSSDDTYYYSTILAFATLWIREIDAIHHATMYTGTVKRVTLTIE